MFMFEGRFYTLAQGAKAAGLSPKQVRNWMDRGYLPLADPGDAGKWRKMTGLEVYELALTARLIRYGASVADAWSQASGLAMYFQLNLESGNAVFAEKDFNQSAAYIHRSANSTVTGYISIGELTEKKRKYPHLAYVELKPLYDAVAKELPDSD